MLNGYFNTIEWRERDDLEPDWKSRIDSRWIRVTKSSSKVYARCFDTIEEMIRLVPIYLSTR